MRAAPKLLIGGGLAAAALGIIAGLASKPDLGTREASVAAPLVQSPRLQLALSQLAAPPVAESQDADAVLRLPPLPPLPPVVAPPRARPVVPAATPQRVEPTVVEAPPLAEPEDRCDAAGSRAEEIVCRDPELAAADARMHVAYGRALDEGAPPEILAAEQASWSSARERAAGRSRKALVALYRERIEDLEALSR